MSDHLFSSLKVIDCASWIAAPVAATILSDFGAEVIKIEPPGAGDPWRARGANAGSKSDAYWQHTSRNKRGLALDLKHEAGLAVLYRLVASADVFITNFPLPVRDRLKLAANDLLPLNSRLIYASFTAYGEAGPEAAKTGYDSTAYWARTGLMDAVRADPETVPARSAPGMGDHPSGTALYAAIVTALYRREKTGKGGLVSTSLLANGLWANASFVQTRLTGEHVPHRPAREHAPIPFANHYRSRDGRWFIMALFNEQRQLRPFLAAIGREHWANDPRFATVETRREYAPEIVRLLDDVFAERDLADWRQILDAAGVTFGVVGTLDDIPGDEQMRACGGLVPFADGKGETISSPFQLQGEEKAAPQRAPAIGQDTDRVLHDAGYTAAEIALLRMQNAVA
jgi:crotonobetainyl-CoA:carnitine CoA-transferase CaiB-like acyl-CoA transferase